MKVRYDQVLRVLFQNNAGLLRGGGRSGFIALPFELNVHHPSKAFVVFNYEYSSRAHNGSTGYVASQSEVPISYLKYSHDAVREVKCF